MKANSLQITWHTYAKGHSKMLMLPKVETFRNIKSYASARQVVKRRNTENIESAIWYDSLKQSQPIE